MKVCPTCNTTYGDEFVYCKNDGTELVTKASASAPVSTTTAAQPKKNAFLVPVIIGSVLVLGTIVWLKISKQVVGSTVASSSQQAPETVDEPLPSLTTATPADSSSSGADELSSAVSSVKEIYSRSDAAYGRRDAQGHMAYAASDWTFQDSDGSRETKADSLRYFEKKFSSTDPKRVVECHIETKVIDSPAPRLEDSGLIVRVAISAQTQDVSGKKRSISVTQEDRWRKVNDDWVCTQSKVLNRN